MSLWVFPTLSTFGQSTANTTLRVIVNSNDDGEAQPDNILNLREAISIVNGTLPLEQLSAIERKNISPVPGKSSQIEFDLPGDRTTIELNNTLPPLTVPVVLDGTTQPGYAQRNGENSAIIPQPIVVIKPAAGVEVFRGFTIISDNVTIRGLSIYGFSSRKVGVTANIPPADIFIGNANDTATFGERGRARNPQRSAPKNILIDSNWLGIEKLENMLSNLSGDTSLISQIKNLSDRKIKIHIEVADRNNYLSLRSAFGIYVFNSLGTKISNNLIADHDGSAIITSAKAMNSIITDNVIVANGFGGMPDAIRLEGNIAETEIKSNLIRDNAGSAIYLFKPSGSIEVRQNKITNNGRQFEQAAVYLMGSDHQIINNQISDQPGPGVVVAAFPNSDRNIILGNEFANLQGLSIDLVTQMNTNLYAYAIGDGPNPKMRSFQRRRQTANFGIDAPTFVSREFFLESPNGNVTLQGTAKPGADIEIYRVNEDSNRRGPLSEPIANTLTDKEGKFSITIPNLKAGEMVSAIANDRESGTSEPAVNAIIKQLL
ncbi:MAG TPA: right-handed parallel beta-helix repeat-containing protein [Leptolyngbyaceae cyanobacterium]